MDFSSATKATLKGTSSKQLGFKKQATYQNVIQEIKNAESSDESRDTSKYIILPEYKREYIY